MILDITKQFKKNTLFGTLMGVKRFLTIRIIKSVVHLFMFYGILEAKSKYQQILFNF